ncbi:PIN domain nuclease [Helicobacter trogontum]|uniref:PIN domain nuclease n=1 Tax=Helicobacter trogontum TaxID=50960 RepID=A0ABQ0D5G2_9HELI
MEQYIFIDTNIIVDSIDKTREYHKQARYFITYCYKQQITLVLSEDMISTIFYIFKKNSKEQKEAEKLINCFQTINNNPKYFKITNFGQDVINKACQNFLNKGGDFEDYLQYYCAEKEKCRFILTSDKKFLKLNMEIPIKNYDELDSCFGESYIKPH